MNNMEYKKFVIIIPSYQNAKWYAKNLGSVFGQNYPKEFFRIVYINDCSTDGTGELVQQFYEKFGRKIKWTLINRESNCGALYNIYHEGIKCQDDEVVIPVDGDDWVANPKILQKLNEVYQDSDLEFTYGSYANSNNNSRGCAAPFPLHVIANKTWRQHNWICSHLHSFKASLIKQIPENDLKYWGNQYKEHYGMFYPVSWDGILYFNLLDRCKKFMYIHDILLIYNNSNELSEYRIYTQKQIDMFAHICNLKK
jgi:glycosyltransferase involved in cell wall biosynthesis